MRLNIQKALFDNSIKMAKVFRTLRDQPTKNLGASAMWMIKNSNLRVLVQTCLVIKINTKYLNIVAQYQELGK